ncbi:hypothetical protein H8D36_05665 [archaeon]|nr:hypothetical protein [archaeon]MBL7056906.1 hypothetical protein [Candidatus Woesearchaeota archaeon]
MELADLKKLEKKGFYFVEPTSKYEIARMKGPCTIILYTTSKLNIQGKEEAVNIVKKELGMKVEEKQTLLSEVIVGSDETMKGDTFGGLVVAGFRANNEERAKLQDLNVQDSKNLDDGQILFIARNLRKEFPKNYFITELFPDEYNERIKIENSTVILNDLHRQVYEALKTKETIHVVDKYPGCKVGDVMEEKAESKYLEVAAASIIAREVAIKQFNELSARAGFIVPKGSTHVSFGLKKLKEKRLKPEEFVKMNFSNVKNAL